MTASDPSGSPGCGAEGRIGSSRPIRSFQRSLLYSLSRPRSRLPGAKGLHTHAHGAFLVDRVWGIRYTPVRLGGCTYVARCSVALWILTHCAGQLAQSPQAAAVHPLPM